MFIGPILTRKNLQEIINLIISKNLSIKDGSGIINEFEKNFADYHKCKFALSQNSGTAAIHSAFFALGIKKDDEVLVPAFGWHACVTPLLLLGAKPIFCNIDDKTFNIDPNELKGNITKKTKAIFVIHLFGHPAKMEPIMHFAKENNLKVIEDCSHSFGAKYKNKIVGTFGDIACFSLQQSKAISAGEGGILITDNKEYFERAIILGHPGRRLSKEKKEYEGISLGLKYRPYPIAISIANNQLKKLDKLNAIRKKIWNYFTFKLKDIKQIELPYTSKDCERGGYFGYRIKYKKEMMKISKKEFIKELEGSTSIFSDEDFMLLFRLPMFRGSFSSENLNDAPDKENDDLRKYGKTSEIYEELFYARLPVIINEKTKETIDYDFKILHEMINKYAK